VLSYLLNFPTEAEESLRTLKPESVHTLRRYGVLNDPDAQEPLRIGCFGAWLIQNQATGMSTAANG
jgi:hypothetical protein